ncbi:hypothetical protein Dimus_007789, partial [Dionaea muscipula]
TAEASLRSQNDDRDRIFDLNRDVGLLKDQQAGLKKEIEKLQGIADNATSDAMTARGEALRAKKDLKISGHEYNSMKLDRDRHQREAEEACKEAERVRQELEAEKKKGGVVDLAAIKRDHFSDSVDEWQETPAGKEWLSDSCRGARMQGYHMALRYLGSRLPSDMTHDDLWGGMPKYADMGIDNADNVFFIEPDVEKTVVDPSFMPESSTA